uniref:Uncharacterized protein TCIL3000_8_770 n=1 Tax=Trypanosoma congolense (strain IL3000) TaxID=1068625 RepID=G0UR57_TRYCI|nr:unnamed protein product [Trypanosoma congolense IL3000]
MLLRVRGNGASAENSQASLVHLRGFRLTNTRHPTLEFKLDGTARSMLFSHFHVGVQIPEADSNVDLSAQLCSAVWREIWNLYDIVYDELCIFPPEAVVVTSLVASGGASQQAGCVGGYAQLTKRQSSQTPVVVTHYFPEGPMQLRLPKDAGSGQLVVLDVSEIPLAEAGTKIATEVAWLAAYASLRGALDTVRHVVVRLPYACKVTEGVKEPTVQEGLDFVAQHLALLVRDFSHETEATGASSSCGVNVHFVGAAAEELEVVLKRLVSDRGGTGASIIFIGDHYEQKDRPAQVRALASAVDTNLQLELVPLKAFISGGEVSWDAATSRENRVLNFCPCCGHCGGH